MEISVEDKLARRMRVWLNGEEVTERAFWFIGPDEPGVGGDGTVGMYVIIDGQFKVRNFPFDNEFQTEYITGKVKWELSSLD